MTAKKKNNQLDINSAIAELSESANKKNNIIENREKQKETKQEPIAEPTDEVEKEKSKKTELFPAPPKKETRSKKLNYLCTPTLHKEFKKKCKEKGVSENEAINQLMQFYIDN